MAHLLYYKKEREENAPAFEQTLLDNEAAYFFEKLKNHYKFTQALYFKGRTGGGSCNAYRIRLARPVNVGVLAHEVAHAIDMKRRSHFEKDGKWHTNRHAKIMKKVITRINENTNSWKEEMARKEAAKMQSMQARLTKLEQKAAFENSPEGKIEKLLAQKRRWESKAKRASNALRRLNRRIAFWEKKVVKV
jgi:hypothetical protein